MEYNDPFTVIAGQEKKKLALMLNLINPALGGVLIPGAQGTAKSTACGASICRRREPWRR